MKKKIIFGLVLAFVISALYSIAVFAESNYATANKLVTKSLNEKKEKANRLEKDPLSFFSGRTVTYDVPLYAQKDYPPSRAICKVNYKNINRKRVENKLQSKAKSSNLTVCDMFEVLSYYIYKGDNESLSKFNDTFDLIARLEDESLYNNYINLYHVAFYAKNKEALDIIYDKIYLKKGFYAADMGLIMMMIDLLPKTSFDNKEIQKEYNKEVLDLIKNMTDDERYDKLVTLYADCIIKGMTYKSYVIYHIATKNNNYDSGQFNLNTLKVIMDSLNS